MEDLIRVIKKIEDEQRFWARMYYSIVPMVSGKISQQIEGIQSFIEDSRRRYRTELRDALGGDFSVDDLKGNTLDAHESIQQYFFPIENKGKLFGIVLPFAKKKKAVLYSGEEDVFFHASQIMKARRYEVTNTVHRPSNDSDLSLLAAISYIVGGK
jgi:hypothetical protein